MAQGTEFRPRILCIVSCTGNQGSKYQNGVLVHVQILGETELGVIREQSSRAEVRPGMAARGARPPF